ncbi:hypothetical protein KW800_00880 [Candidatus Parcubacteria bacterium]|nr:hypothetical protein [Candidatus Parcubacteria bacterium]
MAEEYYGKNLFGEKVDVDLIGADESVAPLSAPKEQFNIFALTDAIGARDKRNAWMIYEKALASGMTADEIFYRVMWGVKSLILSDRCDDALVAGLNPFVYKKSKSFLKNWKSQELEHLSLKLVKGYHESRRGKSTVDSLLERTILSI